MMIGLSIRNHRAFASGALFLGFPIFSYLTAHGYANSPTLLGEVTRFDKDGERYSLAVVQFFIRNQGDGWT